MSCSVLAATGVPVVQIIAIGGALLLVGASLLLLARRRHGGLSTPIGLVLALAAVVVGAASPQAHAATPGCRLGAAPASVGPVSAGPVGPIAAPAARLTVAQTSVLTGLAPGVAPTVITGVVTNHGTASTFVRTVTVQIAAVTVDRAGRCTAADYVLLDTVMPFARTLRPGGSGTFTGARIGFRDRPFDQDACQRAVITLQYVTS